PARPNREFLKREAIISQIVKEKMESRKQRTAKVER
ncbi:MAG: hypothetical protein RI953_945, partial [Pseudomonadota bacterium]